MNFKLDALDNSQPTSLQFNEYKFHSFKNSVDIGNKSSKNQFIKKHVSKDSKYGK